MLISAAMLNLRDLSYRIEGRLLLDGITVQIGAKRRFGLVGRNGCGKTTLLRLIAGRLEPDDGTITCARGRTIALVDQEVAGGPETPRAVVLAADTERTALLAERSGAAPTRAAEIETRLAEIGADAAPARAARLLAGLGIGEAMQHAPLAGLSGGWRMRVALAAALFAEPDLLLLDEPTNHLDLEAASWLEGHLKRYPRSLIVVSHDRGFLDAVPDGILHIDNGRLTAYPGGFTRFARALAERRAHAAAAQAKVDARRERLRGFVARFRANASKARQAQSRLKALAKLSDAPTYVDGAVAELGFPAPKPLAPPLLTLSDAAVGYTQGEPVLRSISLRIDPEDRIALVGANGNGKSTLAKLLAGALAPMAGTRATAPKLGVGYFAQHQLDTLDGDATAFDHLARLTPNARPDQVRARLGLVGFAQEKADVAACDLSGGEKARLNLALIAHHAPQLLILDEPTNHLDIETREALVEALNGFAGAVVLITHDAHLIELVAEQLWLVRDGSVTRLDEDVTAYRATLTARSSHDGEIRERPRRATSDRKAARRDAADDRARLKPLKDAVRRSETQLDEAHGAIDRLERALALAASAKDGRDIAALGKDLATARDAAAQAEAAWLEAAEALEAAQAADQPASTASAKRG